MGLVAFILLSSLPAIAVIAVLASSELKDLTDVCFPRNFLDPISSACPFEGRDYDPISRTNMAVEILLPSGRVEEAVDCLQHVLKLISSGKSTIDDNTVDVIRANLKNMKDAVSPGGKKRLYHNLAGVNYTDLPTSDDDLSPFKDESIQVWDGSLTYDQCNDIVTLFEKSKSHRGIVRRNGKIIEDGIYRYISILLKP